MNCPVIGSLLNASEVSLVVLLRQLTQEGAIRADQVEEIIERAHESPDTRWASPLLLDVREHTRACIDDLCPGPLLDDEPHQPAAKENIRK